MAYAVRIPTLYPRYSIGNLVEKRRDILRYARSLPPGPLRNQLLQTDATWRSVFRSLICPPTFAVRHGCIVADWSPEIAGPLVYAHVVLLQPIYKRFLLGSDLCGKRRSDSFVEHQQLVDRH
jgi:hypothetical protein